jgi:hypothetical protein
MIGRLPVHGHRPSDRNWAGLGRGLPGCRGPGAPRLHLVETGGRCRWAKNARGQRSSPRAIDTAGIGSRPSRGGRSRQVRPGDCAQADRIAHVASASNVVAQLKNIATASRG